VGGIYRVTFPGCAPEPLSHYLKGLAIFRLVAEQLDPDARASWQGDTLTLETRCDAAAIERFFLEAYRPTPIVSPWNGGSGFFAKDNQDGMAAILSAPAGSRFAHYADTIRAAQRLLTRLGLTTRPDSGEAKAQLLDACRAQLSDEALPWLDAAFILTSSDKGETTAAYPPLLGTGGNDGRLEFSNNFMQRVGLTLFDAATGAAQPQAASLLRAALWGEAADGMARDAIGQFFPSASGGPNMGSGFGGQSVVNPWDFVLTLEGSVLFSASAVRRMSAQWMPPVCAPPFTVRAISAGYGSASPTEGSRAEVWLPLWRQPASLRELRALLSEGRARLQQRPVQNALDFSRAVASLGVDRGIHAFARVGLLERNGRAYFGVPLGRFSVPDQPSDLITLLDDIQDWVAAVQRAANDDLAPRSVQAAVQQLQSDIIDLCRLRDAPSLTRVFLSLGRCERALSRSVKWLTNLKFRVSPLTLRDPKWLLAAYKSAQSASDSDDASVFRIAASLASLGLNTGLTTDPRKPQSDAQHPAQLPVMREHLEPIQRAQGGGWWEFTASPSPEVVWHEGALVRFLCAVMQRRLIAAQQSSDKAFPDYGYGFASFDDLNAFMEGRLDERALQDMLWACALVSAGAYSEAASQGLLGIGGQLGPRLLPSALYASLRLCFSRWAPSSAPNGEPIPIVPTLFHLAATGQAAEATRRALRRLRASGAVPVLMPSVAIPHGVDATQRAAAALLIPLAKPQHVSLCAQLLVKKETP
jgi:CRISPR-associated protein Csx17